MGSFVRMFVCLFATDELEHVLLPMMDVSVVVVGLVWMVVGSVRHCPSTIPNAKHTQRHRT